MSRRALDALAAVAVVGLGLAIVGTSGDDRYLIFGIPLIGLAAAVIVWHLVAWPTSLASEHCLLAQWSG